jgi:hypothetical protein
VRLVDVAVGIALHEHLPGRARLVHMNEVRPYRPLPLYRAGSIVQHYMQPEEFKAYHERATAADAEAEAAEERDREVANVYDMFVGAKVLRR